MKSRFLHVALASLAVFLSGAGALTYEILWQRRLCLIFGASAPATTAILTAIFLGIALGSRMARPLADRIVHPAKTYAALELLIGIWGILVPWLLGISDQLYVNAASFWGEDGRMLAVARFVLAVLPLLPATLAMGATVPVMIQAVSQQDESRVAWAYGINTLGAMTGCLLTGFFWIRLLGLTQTRYIAVGLNGLAFLLLGGLHLLSRAESQRQRATPDNAGFVRSAWLAPAYFLAGFVALGLQVVWLRFLGIVNSNSTVTFTLTLVVYLLGMGLGSLAGYPVTRRRWSAGTVFLLANLGVAVSALLTYWVLYGAVRINHAWITLPSLQGTLSLAHIYQAEALIVASLLLLPTLFMGLVYPAVCEMGSPADAHSPAWNADSYFFGTLGSVAGILLVGSVMIPHFGLHGSFSLLIAVSVLIGCLCRWDRFPRSRWATVLLAAILLVWAAAYSVNPRPVLRNTVAVQQSGVWMEYPISQQQRPFSELVHVKAGRTATVTVKKTPGKPEHFVYVDDQLVASTNIGAKVDAHMLAHLPLLLHPGPETALTVGFGSGGTSHAMTTHRVDTYCVEIEREVPGAAPYLRYQNFNVLAHPRFTLLINDARDHLHVTSRKYDVISTDVTNLQYKQNSSLYTVEYFSLMKNCLQEDGIACAWIPMAAISTRELRILMNGFGRVFPHASLWFMNHTHTNFGILIGTPGPLEIDFSRFQSGFANDEIAESLGLIGLTDPLQLVHCLHLDERGYRAFCDGAALHTDDSPILEFTSPLSFYNYYETFRDNLQATLRFRPSNIRRYVKNLPARLDEEWSQHAIAARCFCYVVLEAYNFIIHRTRGNREAAVAAVDRAVNLIRQGMSARPDDQLREEYYEQLVQEAYQWGQSSSR